jgi:hypothetical protein
MWITDVLLSEWVLCSDLNLFYTNPIFCGVRFDNKFVARFGYVLFWKGLQICFCADFPGYE